LAVEHIKKHAASTFSPSVLSGLGSFGSFFDIDSIVKHYRHPVMVQSIDGVGTKIMIASMTGDFSTIGRDLLSACCNDIIVHGAKPATFLDYIANDKLNPERVAQMVAGMAAGCREESVSLVGGETAEMPGTYRKGEHDLVGIVTGFVERDAIINGSEASAGDIIFGIPSSGLHTNGYSLARKVLFEHAGLSTSSVLPESYGPTERKTLGQLLLKPHINYTSSVHKLLASGITIKSMSHITGGGLIENVPRTLPENISAVIDPRSWEVPPIFRYIGDLGEISPTEMFHAFNMGIGYTIVIPKHEAQKAEKLISECFGCVASVIGELKTGNGKTILPGITDTPVNSPGQNAGGKQ
jgi:phosphoribosylformylglycinamidine cyclo-ligase